MTSRRLKLRDIEIDVLLLSIIRAYDHPDRRTEQDRLADIRNALFGEKRGTGRAAVIDGLANFKVQAELRKREIENLILGIAKNYPSVLTPEWQAKIAHEPMSARAAAREFKKFAGRSENVEDTSVEDRLRRKARDRLSSREMATYESIFDPEEHRTKAMISILELLQTLGVESRSIWDEND